MFTDCAHCKDPRGHCCHRANDYFWNLYSIIRDSFFKGRYLIFILAAIFIVIVNINIVIIIIGIENKRQKCWIWPERKWPRDWEKMQMESRVSKKFVFFLGGAKEEKLIWEKRKMGKKENCTRIIWTGIKGRSFPYISAGTEVIFCENSFFCPPGVSLVGFFLEKRKMLARIGRCRCRHQIPALLFIQVIRY